MNPLASGFMAHRVPDFQIEAQPDHVTCGATCLQAVYRYYGDDVSVRQLVSEVRELASGGTLSALLGAHALERGYRATIYTCDLTLFDPTWFERKADLVPLLKEQASHKQRPALQVATEAYLDFLEAGGRVRFRPFEPALIRDILKRGLPILTGLSATYLYGCAREREADPRTLVYDDVRGEPMGHFVVVFGYHAERREVWLADPLHDNPLSGERTYSVDIQRLLGAIFLGASTYDANLLVLERPEPGPHARAKAG